MLFNSLSFAFFLPIVFLIYWALQRNKLLYQNFFLLLASYVFYGWWNPKFLALILLSTLVDFFIARAIAKTEYHKKQLLLLSIVVNIGILAIFKYYNFFTHSFEQLVNQFGFHPSFVTLNIVLPVGISFYTFQTLSYTIDVYRKRLKPTSSFIQFACYVAFFPQLVAGPIERATHLLPQFSTKRKFTYENGVLGCRQILWGLFKKMVVADNCGVIVNQIFESPSSTGLNYLIGAILFAIQIYGDFSGYSDIAIGVARLFGFDLRQNFNFPYFAKNLDEFWKRWHISLTSWFRDYVYIPLGGNQLGLIRMSINFFLVFLLSGLWHGANFTFLAWGVAHALLTLPLVFLRKKSFNFPKVLSILFTFLIVSLLWVFFRAENIQKAISIYGEIFSLSILKWSSLFSLKKLLVISVFCFFCFGVEFLGRESSFALEYLPNNFSRRIRVVFYMIILISIGLFAQTAASPFIYFQF